MPDQIERALSGFDGLPAKHPAPPRPRSFHPPNSGAALDTCLRCGKPQSKAASEYSRERSTPDACRRGERLLHRGFTRSLLASIVVGYAPKSGIPVTAV